jgi:hypothetical protein
MFRTSHDKYRTATAHNTNKNVPTSIRQQEGIGLFSGKKLRQYIVKCFGDFRGLGRWHSWIIQANPCHRTRLVVAYQVGRLRQKRPHTIYQQHIRYMQIKGISGTPRELFSSDFVNAILQWIEQGDRIVLFVDANEHILTGKLPTVLAKLGLQEVTYTLWGESEPRTYVHGDGAPIDGVFHTPDIKVTAIMQLSFHEGVGDHRTTILNISTRLAIRKYEQQVVTPQARRLTNKNNVTK